MRTITLSTGITLGWLEFVGSCLWAVGGAGIYGSPLQGDSSWATCVILFLLAGPMTLLPASLLAIWRPRWAGAWLLVASLASAVLAVLVMMPPPNTWSPGGDSLAYYTFKWSLALILPFSLPMLILGLVFLGFRCVKNDGPGGDSGQPVVIKVERI